MFAAIELHIRRWINSEFFGLLRKGLWKKYTQSFACLFLNGQHILQVRHEMISSKESTHIGSMPFGSFFTTLLSVCPSFLLSQIVSVV